MKKRYNNENENENKSFDLNMLESEDYEDANFFYKELQQ